VLPEAQWSPLTPSDTQFKIDQQVPIQACMTDLAELATITEYPAAPGAQLPPPVFAPPSGPAPAGLVPPPPPTLTPTPALAPVPDEVRPAAAKVALGATPVVPTYSPAVPPVIAAPSPIPAMAPIPSYEALTSASTSHKKKRGVVRRFVKFVFVMSLLGGIGAAGYVYGPTLLERLREEAAGEEAADEQPTVDEPEAPLAFPSQTDPPIEVRNATFVLDDLDPDGTARRYEVTTDFETRISRVLIDRNELPTLEVMTFLDSAVVRRIDETVWYQTPRGQFPLDDQLERDRWVRHLDELIPAVNRSSAAIEASTTALLAGERMRHLVISIDPELLAGPTLTTESLGAPAVVDGLSDGASSEANTSVGPATDAQSSDVPTEAVVDAANAIAPTPPAPAWTPPRGLAGAEPVSIEIWIDSRGLIRQLITPVALGGETVTVLAISADAWIPEFPAEEQIEPLTASALVKLGL
jgi:hypothetical protein